VPSDRSAAMAARAQTMETVECVIFKMTDLPAERRLRNGAKTKAGPLE
jgi:hypothetical protein